MSVAKKDYKELLLSPIDMKANEDLYAYAYDYTMAKIVDTAGIDVILVGDQM
jgi:3-methyl-2-oxobutanoate hydroxymethyltransferase